MPNRPIFSMKPGRTAQKRRLATKAVIASRWNPGLSLFDELMRLYRRKRFPPARVDSLGLSNSNTFALALADQITLQLSARGETRIIAFLPGGEEAEWLGTSAGW